MGGGLTNKAFTLIELLAVIIILAVIALIATPIVLNVVEQAKRKANLQSVNGLLDGAKYYYTESLLDLGMQSKMNGHTNIIDDIKVNGDKPTNGHLYMNASGQTELQVVYKNRCYTKSFSDSKVTESDDVENCGAIDYSCRATQGTGSNLGDIITCGSESFYVLSNNGTDIRMLSKYNLKVGYVENNEDAWIAYNTTYTVIPVTEQGYGLQDSNAGIGIYNSDDYIISGVVEAINGYSQSDIERYVNGYKNKLISFNVPVKSATLLEKSELEEIVGAGDLEFIPNGESAGTYGPDDYELLRLNNAPEWFYDRKYFILPMTSSKVYSIYPGGLLDGMYHQNIYSSIRPVIVIPVTALK